MWFAYTNQVIRKSKNRFFKVKGFVKKHVRAISVQQNQKLFSHQNMVTWLLVRGWSLSGCHRVPSEGFQVEIETNKRYLLVMTGATKQKQPKCRSMAMTWSSSSSSSSSPSSSFILIHLEHHHHAHHRHHHHALIITTHSLPPFIHQSPPKNQPKHNTDFHIRVAAPALLRIRWNSLPSLEGNLGGGHKWKAKCLSSMKSMGNWCSRKHY